MCNHAMKLLVLCAGVLAGFLGVVGEPVLNGEKTGKAQGYGKDNKKNIVGREKYPYMVYLEIDDPRTEEDEYIYSLNCGGTLLSGRVVLTAAHCFTETIGEIEVYATAGILHLDEEEKAQRVKMYDHLVHEDYVPLQTGTDKNGKKFEVSNPHDIALVWLEKNFIYSPTVRHIELMPPKVELGGKMGFILGWGQTEQGYCSKMLRKANLRVIHNSECAHHAEGKNNILTKAMLCIKSDDGRSSQCKGDSGGPFIVDNKLAGVISRSFKQKKTLPNGSEISTTNPKFGAIATKVGYYNEWIKINIKQGPPKNRKKSQNKSTITQPGRPDKPVGLAQANRPGSPGKSAKKT